MFKTEDGRKPPKCKLWLDDKKISEADERYRVEYKADIEMFRVSISDFKSELKGVYECVVSTAEEPTVSTAVEVVISCKLIHTCSCVFVIKDGLMLL